MRVNHHRAGWVIWGSFALALMLGILPLPAWAAAYRPLWVLVTLIYWCVAVPERIGIGFGWSVGLLVDVMSDALLGQNALALAVVAWLCGHLAKRLRVAPMLQQLLTVALLVVVHQLVIFWIGGLTGAPPHGLAYWLPVVSSALIWPWVLSLLRDLRTRFRVR